MSFNIILIISFNTVPEIRMCWCAYVLKIDQISCHSLRLHWIGWHKKCSPICYRNFHHITSREHSTERRAEELSQYCRLFYERTTYVRISEITGKICWFRNSCSQWKCVKYVTLPTQACLLNNHFFAFTTRRIMCMRPIPLAALFKAWVCGHSLDESAGSNLVGNIDVCLLWVLCFVR
jgi:hypothetical protein